MNARDERYEVNRTAQALIERYGEAAFRVAREWADIKGSQGGSQTAERWRRVANVVVQLQAH